MQFILFIISPEFLGHTVERWEGEQTYFVSTCCALLPAEHPSKRNSLWGDSINFFFGPARWLWEQMHQVTQQVHTQVVHQNFSVIVFLVEGSLLTAEVLQEINCWRRSFMNWFCLFFSWRKSLFCVHLRRGGSALDCGSIFYTNAIFVIK